MFLAFASAPSLARLLPQSLPPPLRREGTAHRQNLYTQTPDSPHLCGRLVYDDLGPRNARNNILKTSFSFFRRRKKVISMVPIGSHEV